MTFFEKIQNKKGNNKSQNIKFLKIEKYLENVCILEIFRTHLKEWAILCPPFKLSIGKARHTLGTFKAYLSSGKFKIGMCEICSIIQLYQ